jgi:hypothetical protein
MFSRMPRPAKTTSMLVPPSDTSGSGTPVMGVFRAVDVDARLADDHRRMPVATVAEQVLQSRAMRKQAHASAT